MIARPAENGAVGECFVGIGAEISEDSADGFANFGGFTGRGDESGLNFTSGNWRRHRLVAGGEKEIEKRFGISIVAGGREKDGGRREAFDELTLNKIEVVKTVEENWRLRERIWLRRFQPIAKLPVGGGEFFMFGIFTRKLGETSFLEVGEGGEKRSGKTGRVVDGRKVAGASLGELPTEKFERER